MQIFVDADECPVVRIIEELAEKYRIEDACNTIRSKQNHGKEGYGSNQCQVE